jgi:hypothetical protein
MSARRLRVRARYEDINLEFLMGFARTTLAISERT